ncbi:MAG TPA: YDG domain-containing protein [Mesorhizobium sp.]|jgi:filamentous hemagglutinin family protein|uniref:YDG domain-containing protein n=1 Tax=Mesorhizobium sp. TaxID=1871066 RepID=UPI002DDCE32F|nr:YDG domain-containing protein [Mesorhizobium sp.]HEV2501721.1 YDG domain-containing protein [Mesorhizobium sp.]
MNRIYRHIWSKSLGRLIVVPECARGAGGGKAGRRRNRLAAGTRMEGGAAASTLAALLSSTVLVSPALAQEALPTGGQVVSGSATIGANGGAMTINQSSDRMIANWQSFSIGAGNSVTFNQPGATSTALNRVTGQDPSQILGNLTANGQVFLINPNGVAVGKTGRVQTGAFVASTLGISNEKFLAGHYNFTGTGGSIVNEGDIAGGTVALIAPSVSNAGTISGNTALAGGTDVLLDFNGDGLLSVEVKGSTMETLVENKGVIKASKGVAILTAKGASAAMKGVVNNTGTIEANSIGTRDGRILLLGDMQHGEVKVAGKLKARKVETSAAKVKIDKTAKVETSGGHWLIDPVNITIDADYAAALQASLATGDVTVTTYNAAGGDDGNITVNAPVTWGSHVLTLRADKDIVVNASLNSTGTTLADGLVLQYAQTNAAGSYTINAPVNLAAGSLFRTQKGAAAAIDWTVITALGVAGSATGRDLQGINGNLSGYYVLGADIDATATAGWNGGAGFDPLGDYGSRFTGALDGLGHVVKNLTINRPNEGDVGLLGFMGGSESNGGLIRNIGVSGGHIKGSYSVGGLVGGTEWGTIANAWSSATVEAMGDGIGGLVGYNNRGTISHSHATGSVLVPTSNFARWNVGGLVGFSNGAVSDSFATGSVRADNASSVGGLVGLLEGGTVLRSYSSGTVSGNNYVGGLVGYMKFDTNTITQSYATGSVNGGGYVGGLVGWLAKGTVSQAFSTGKVTGQVYVGGLAGVASPGSFIRDSFFDRESAGTDRFIYWQPGWGSPTMSNIGGYTTAEMLTQATYAGWDFANDWYMIEGNTRPFLRSEYSTVISSVNQLQLMALNVGASYRLLHDIDFGSLLTDDSRSDMWATSSSAGKGFLPVGDNASMGLFTGRFDGQGRTISNLVINRPDMDGVGLFGQTYYAQIRNVGLVGGKVIGRHSTGSLVGSTNNGSLDNVFSTMNVSGANYTGGLVGQNNAQINTAYSTGTVSGADNVGGLLGRTFSTVRNAYASGAVSGNQSVGGLVGTNQGTLDTAYASGAVGGSQNVGGLVGVNLSTINNSFAAGAVSGNHNTGALVGQNQATISNSSWSSAASGRASACGNSNCQPLTDLTLQQLNDPFRLIAAGWDFASSWATPKTGGAPVLRSLTSTPIYNYYVRVGGNATGIYGDTPSTSGVAFSGIGAGNVTAGWGSGINTFNAGTYGWATPGMLSMSYSTGDAGDYYMGYDTGGLTINKRVISLSGSRGYDRTSVLNASIFSLLNLANGETLNLTGQGMMVDNGLGTGKVVALGTLALADGTGLASNYTLTNGTYAVDIVRAVITGISGILAANKTYDGSTTATLNLSGATFQGLVAGEELLLASATGTYSDKNAGSGKTVTIANFVLGGADADHYILDLSSITTTANITKAVISSVSGITASDKVYDGQANATLNLSGASFTGMVNGDRLTVASATGVFGDKNAGNGKTVTISGLMLGGDDAGNYTLASTTASTMATIEKRSVSIGGYTAAGRIYNGLTGVQITNVGMFDNMIAGDDLSSTFLAATFADKNAGNGKTVTISGLALGGADAGNYALVNTTATTSADITKATISAITGITAANKVYDGSTAAALDASGAGFSGMVNGDRLTIASATGAFSDKNAGNGKTVSISGLTLSGDDAGNYALANTNASTTADIARATISAITGITAANKVYNGSTAAMLNAGAAGFTGMVSGDRLTVASATGAFSDKNAGNGKTVSISGLALGGDDAGNYTLSNISASTTADIARATISAITGITASNRIYNGSTAAMLDASDAGFTGMVSGDRLTVASATGAFGDRNAGNGKAVTISGLALGGGDAGNYTLANTTATTTADITRATISAVTGITASDKVYDGLASASLNLSGAGFTGMVSGDQLTVASAIGAFGDRNAGNGKTVTISGLALGGDDAGNYTLASTTATTAATIEKRSVSVGGFTAADRVYNGLTGVQITNAGMIDNVIANDDLASSFLTATFSDKNAGNGKVVSIGGIALSGTDAGNYTLVNTTATTSANIIKATISAVTGISAANKTYDGSTAAVLNANAAGFTGMVGSDRLAVASASGAFSDKNAGNGKTVLISGLALGGDDAGNYTLASTTASTSADISKATISAVTGITAANKVYDGSTAAALDAGGAGFTGMINGDRLTVTSATGAFSDKNAGNGKTVSISGLTLGGSDAGNYTLANTTASTSADISKASLLLVDLAAANKIYDGSRSATLTGGHLDGLFGSDQVSFTHSNALFSDKNAGTGKVVILGGITLSGRDAANYSIGETALATADIARATIFAIAGIRGVNKTYDGTTVAPLDVSQAVFIGAVAGDLLQVSAASGQFPDANPGQGKAISITGLQLGGIDAQNYVLDNDKASATADVNAPFNRPLPPRTLVSEGFSTDQLFAFDAAPASPALVEFPAWPWVSPTDETTLFGNGQ